MNKQPLDEVDSIDDIVWVKQHPFPIWPAIVCVAIVNIFLYRR